MSLLDEIVTKYGFDKLNTLTYYPSILNFHNIENNKAIDKLSVANYQPVPAKPNQMKVVIKELVNGDILRIISINNDFFVGNKTDIIHARGDRIILDSKIVPMYKALSPFFGANMTNNERLMVLYTVVYNTNVYNNVDELKCVLVEGFTLKLNDVITLCRDNSIEQIQEWVNTLHQPFWSINTLNRFGQACNIEPLSILEETTLDTIPTNINDMKKWLNKYKQSSLVKEEKKEEKKAEPEQKEKTFTLDDIIQNTESKDINNISKEDDIDFLFPTEEKTVSIPSKGIIIRALDRSYIRKVNISNY